MRRRSWPSPAVRFIGGISFLGLAVVDRLPLHGYTVHLALDHIFKTRLAGMAPQMPTTPQRSGSPGSGPASLTVSAMRTRTTLQVANNKDPDQALTYLHRVCSLASPKSLRERSATAVCSSRIPCGTSTSSSIEALTWSCSCSAGGTVGCRPS